MEITKYPIPKNNWSVGRGQYRPEIVVIHISDGNAKSVIEEFTGKTEKSSHYFIKRDGSIIQFVDEKNVAFSNGIVHLPVSKWVLEHKGLNPNLCSISVEHEGKNQDATEIQYQTSADLISGICKRWLIPIGSDTIIPHYSIRQDKKCPRPIDVLKIINLIKEKQNLKKIEELKTVKVSLLKQVLVALQKKLTELLTKIK